MAPPSFHFSLGTDLSISGDVSSDHFDPSAPSQNARLLRSVTEIWLFHASLRLGIAVVGAGSGHVDSDFTKALQLIDQQALCKTFSLMPMRMPAMKDRLVLVELERSASIEIRHDRFILVRHHQYGLLGLTAFSYLSSTFASSF